MAAAAAMSLTVCLIEMFSVSESGFIGFTMNLLASLAFIVPASAAYQKKRTIGGAVVGLVCGAVLMTASMLLWNWLITPLYQQGLTREEVTAMLLPVFLPFNAVKGGLNLSLTLLLYQPVNNALRRLHLLPPLPDGKMRRRLHVGTLLLGAGLLVLCIVCVMAMLGKF